MSRKDLASTCVLVVDDKPLARQIICRWLKRAGAQTFEAGNGEEAEALLKDGQFDLILTDIDMPVMDGLTLTQRVRARARTADVGILVVTGDLRHQRLLDALGAGADDFITKPILGEVLLARVRSLIRRRRAEGEARRLALRLSSYVSTPVREPSPLFGGIEEVEVTVLFSDLRGFTSTSERVEPALLFESLNSVLTLQVEKIQKHGGYVDKFSGDGLLAVFESEGAAKRACLAAAEITAWARNSGAIGPWGSPPIGFGIHAGMVMRGDLGSESRREFTVIGSVVNAAARLCGAASALEVVVSAVVWEEAREFLPFTSGGDIALKGLAKPMQVYRLSAS